jgi:sugar O-acyltransferase (sialic acid O-acetyltransferase NeuD family)
MRAGVGSLPVRSDEECVMKRKLYVFGAQNFAEVAYYLFTTDGDYELAGFTVDGAYMRETTFNGLPVIPFEELSRTMDKERDEIFVAIGVAKINSVRAQKVADLQAQGFRIASFVSSRAQVPRGFEALPNTMIMDHVNMHPLVRVGANSILWSNTWLALKVHIGDNCWVTSAVMGDSSVLGDFTFVGINATIAPFVKVGKQNLIGAGAVVQHDTPDYAVLRGPRSVPSRVSSLRLQNIPLIR